MAYEIGCRLPGMLVLEMCIRDRASGAARLVQSPSGEKLTVV